VNVLQVQTLKDFVDVVDKSESIVRLARTRRDGEASSYLVIHLTARTKGANGLWFIVTLAEGHRIGMAGGQPVGEFSITKAQAIARAEQIIKSELERLEYDVRAGQWMTGIDDAFGMFECVNWKVDGAKVEVDLNESWRSGKKKAKRVVKQDNKVDKWTTRVVLRCRECNDTFDLGEIGLGFGQTDRPICPRCDWVAASWETGWELVDVKIDKGDKS